MIMKKWEWEKERPTGGDGQTGKCISSHSRFGFHLIHLYLCGAVAHLMFALKHLLLDCLSKQVSHNSPQDACTDLDISLTILNTVMFGETTFITSLYSIICPVDLAQVHNAAECFLRKIKRDPDFRSRDFERHHLSKIMEKFALLATFETTTMGIWYRGNPGYSQGWAHASQVLFPEV